MSFGHISSLSLFTGDRILKKVLSEGRIIK